MRIHHRIRIHIESRGVAVFAIECSFQTSLLNHLVCSQSAYVIKLNPGRILAGYMYALSLNTTCRQLCMPQAYISQLSPGISAVWAPRYGFRKYLSGMDANMEDILHEYLLIGMDTVGNLVSDGEYVQLMVITQMLEIIPQSVLLIVTARVIQSHSRSVQPFRIDILHSTCT